MSLRELEVNSKTKVKWFYGGFCLFCWINLTSYDQSGGNVIQTLFECEIKNYGKISLVFEGNKLNYCIDFSNMNQRASTGSRYEGTSIYIAQIPWDTWCFIGLNHQRKLYHKSILNITLNDEFERVFQIEYPKLPDGLF
jgi:hypothetical protein